MTTCPNCGAAAPETSKDRARFLRRHPKKCVAHARFQKDLAAETRSVDADERYVHFPRESHRHCWEFTSTHGNHETCCTCQLARSDGEVRP